MIIFLNIVGFKFYLVPIQILKNHSDLVNIKNIKQS